MVAISRRSFIEKLGLGVGATLLSPIAGSLIDEARGQSASRQIAYFFLLANGIHPIWNFTPPEFVGAMDDVNQPVLDGPTKYTWPAMFKPLEPYRSRIVLMDGLYNVNRVGGDGGHSLRWGALSCMPSGNGADITSTGTPGGITLDQFLASKIGANMPRKSVLIGVSTKPQPLYASVFASGRDKPEPQIQSPTVLFNDLFGTQMATASGVSTGALKQRVIFDTLRADISRMEGALAQWERRKLETYLSVMEDFEKRQKALGALTCPNPGAPAAANEATPDDKLESLHSMAVLAAVCGITNVVGVALGCGFSHDTFPELKKVLLGTGLETLKWDGGWSNIGHQGREIRKPVLDAVYQWNGRMMAGAIDALSKVKVGNGTLFDGTLMMYTSENGEEHHAGHTRWPLALVGNAGGKLKIDGRFIRYPARGKTGSRPLCDLYSTIATAFGIPTSDFGKNGNETPRGVLDGMLA